MSDERPPDFAMARAVEILAGIYERQRRIAEAPPPPLDKVVTIFNETIALDVTKTTRKGVEQALGIAFAYPVGGWHTYCVRSAENAAREFVSLFYSHGELVSAELYWPKVERAPALEPRPLRFRFVPGEITLGMQLAALPEGFTRIPVPPELGSYADIFEARYPGGVSYAMGNKGVIERLALYALRERASPTAKG
ncbi:MAG TPA: hypothetical protein VMH02_11950 [Verrucomicrobiae bacterium]|nr:hypothetical protein [Verrucomicrobiae bacterium]